MEYFFTNEAKWESLFKNIIGWSRDAKAKNGNKVLFNTYENNKKVKTTDVKVFIDMLITNAYDYYFSNIISK